MGDRYLHQSLDLCAAALGRTFCGHKSSRELALPDFDTSKSSKKAPKLLAALPRPARDWMRDLLSDARYKEIKTLEIGSHIRA